MYSKLKNFTPLTSLLDKQMNTITDNIIDRDELQNNYVQEVIDGLDLKDCLAMLYDYLSNDMDKLTLNELIEDVEEYYPHLLEDN
tara:strand:+ start:46 stop:300 length:255 start_codon:yes stop_codon:yes gene_type:complete